MSIVLVPLAWIVCGVCSYGLMYSSLQWNPHHLWQAYNTRLSDRGLAAVVAVAGPLGVVIVFLSGAYDCGWRVDAVPPSICLADFRRKYPTLCDERDVDFVILRDAANREEMETAA